MPTAYLLAGSALVGLARKEQASPEARQTSKIPSAPRTMASDIPESNGVDTCTAFEGAKAELRTGKDGLLATFLSYFSFKRDCIEEACFA